jgi:hypothetical protein
MPFVPQDQPVLQGDDAVDSAKNGDGCRQLLGLRLTPTLPKISAIHQRLGVCYLLGDAGFADRDVVFLLPFLV